MQEVLVDFQGIANFLEVHTVSFYVAWFIDLTSFLGHAGMFYNFSI